MFIRGCISCSVWISLFCNIKKKKKKAGRLHMEIHVYVAVKFVDEKVGEADFAH